MPHVVVLAGPNGAGKSTAAPYLLREALGVDTYVNADVIAQGLSGFAPQTEAVRAGRIMLEQLVELAARGRNFAFESTLAGRTILQYLGRFRDAGYAVHLLYLWLPSADLAVERVRFRVRAGGHDVPEKTIRRRYKRSMENLFEIYLPLATTWSVYDGSVPGVQPVVAYSKLGGELIVVDRQRWEQLNDQVRTRTQRKQR